MTYDEMDKDNVEFLENIRFAKKNKKKIMFMINMLRDIKAIPN